MEIITDSVEQAFHMLLDKLKSDGITTAPRGFQIKELINCNVTITNPRHRIIGCIERAFSPAYAFGELLWYLQGRNDLEMMEYYSKFMKKCTDDGVTLNSAYGYRMFTTKQHCVTFNQWENVKRILSQDRDSRQAIIHLHLPNDKKTNDEVCTLCLQFLIRNDKLNLIVTMRSNDVVLGFTYDAFNFTMLQEMMANELHVELGTYYHHVGSMHIYDRHFAMLEKHTSYDMTFDTDMTYMTAFDSVTADFEDMFEIETRFRHCYTASYLSLWYERYFKQIVKTYNHRSGDLILRLLILASFTIKACSKVRWQTDNDKVEFHKRVIFDVQCYSDAYSDVALLQSLELRNNLQTR